MHVNKGQRLFHCLEFTGLIVPFSKSGFLQPSLLNRVYSYQRTLYRCHHFGMIRCQGCNIYRTEFFLFQYTKQDDVMMEIVLLPRQTKIFYNIG